MKHQLQLKIEAYITHKMSDDERCAFEKEMADDSELAFEVEVFRLEQEGTELLFEENLKSKMQIWKTELADEAAQIQLPVKDNTKLGSLKPSPLRLLFKRASWIGIAASLLVLFWVIIQKGIKKESIYVVQPPISSENPQNTTPSVSEPAQQLEPIKDVKKGKDDANQATIKEPNSDTPDNYNKYQQLAMVTYKKDNVRFEYTNRGENNANDPLIQVIQAWGKGDFQKIIQSTTAIPNSSPVYFRSQEILAHAYFQTKNFVAAEKTFAMLSAVDKGAIGENAEWYQLLSLLMLDRNDEAHILMAKISKETEHPAHDKVIHLKKYL